MTSNFYISNGSIYEIPNQISNRYEIWVLLQLVKPDLYGSAGEEIELLTQSLLMWNRIQQMRSYQLVGIW